MTVEGTPIDHAPWLLGTGDSPLADWLAGMTATRLALFTLSHWEAQVFPVGTGGCSTGEHEEKLEHQLTFRPFVRSKENILLNLMSDLAAVCSSGQWRAAMNWPFECSVHLRTDFLFLIFVQVFSHIDSRINNTFQMIVAILAVRMPQCYVMFCHVRDSCVFIQKMPFDVQILKLKCPFGLAAESAALLVSSLFSHMCVHTNSCCPLISALFTCTSVQPDGAVQSVQGQSISGSN